MTRILLALLIALWSWPLVAASGDVRAHEHRSGSHDFVESSVTESGGALRAAGGWQLGPRPDSGLRHAERDGGRRHGTGTGNAHGNTTPTLVFGRIAPAGEAVRGSDVPRLRYDHLPYFATAPPRR